MIKEIELLAPGGDVDSIKAAIAAGADAIYCGLDHFNARNSAPNIRFEDLQAVLKLAHENHCKVYLTLNILILENEIPAFISILNKLINTSIDGVIIQDLGMLYLLCEYFKGIKIHASTQLTTHNEGQMPFLSKLNASRVNLSRELNIHEIKALTNAGHENNLETEVFVHGSYCISFSGICYMSSVHGGNSGNRGRCSQPCRDRYEATQVRKNYPLNLKDNSAYFDLREIVEAGVSSLKIEGRIKKPDYVFTVVDSWKKQIRSFYDYKRLSLDNSNLYKVFNRDFSNSFLKGDINKDMFIDNPRDHSIKHLSEVNHDFAEKNLEQIQMALYDEKEEMKTVIAQKIKALSIAKSPLIISVSGGIGSPLKVTVKTPDRSFVVLSVINLVHAGEQTLNHEMVFKRLKALNETEYYIEKLELENLERDLFIPFHELTSIKKKLLFILNGSKKVVDPIDLPIVKKQNKVTVKPTLSVLISTPKDLLICNETSAELYFQLPGAFEKEYPALIDLFIKNKNLIPWFPSVLIGDNYTAAVEFLRVLQPKLIVTNNTGIGYEACKHEISWIAGPCLNIVNSLSMLCLKEKFGGYGAFISNELNKNQIRNIRPPDDFKLYYSIYHPIVLMTSRQCLFHQVTGCEKSKMDDSCIQLCEKSSSITNLKKVTFCIEKSKGNYHSIYNQMNFLNTNIVSDLPDVFTSFFIDLRDIKTETRIAIDKSGIIKLFENLLNGNSGSIQELEHSIYPTTDEQYIKGI